MSTAEKIQALRAELLVQLDGKTAARLCQMLDEIVRDLAREQSAIVNRKS